MNCNETKEMKETYGKIKGCTSKITHISIVKCPIVPNLS